MPDFQSYSPVFGEFGDVLGVLGDFGLLGDSLGVFVGDSVGDWWSTGFGLDLAGKDGDFSSSEESRTSFLDGSTVSREAASVFSMSAPEFGSDRSEQQASMTTGYLF